MTELIPHLSHLAESTNGWRDHADFARMFLKLHDEQWNVAEQHWEVVVARVLETDAVDVDASGRIAMRQAVRASVALLQTLQDHGRCPLCPAKAAVNHAEGTS